MKTTTASVSRLAEKCLPRASGGGSRASGGGPSSITASGRSVGQCTVSSLQRKLDLTRAVDRRSSGASFLGQLRPQVAQRWSLLGDVLDHEVRIAFARVLVHASTLAERQRSTEARSANPGSTKTGPGARHLSRNRARWRRTRAEKGAVLLDTGRAGTAVELTRCACGVAQHHRSGLLDSWLFSGRGEALARGHLVFEETQLARWRGSALARLGAPEAVSVLPGCSIDSTRVCACGDRPVRRSPARAVDARTEARGVGSRGTRATARHVVGSLPVGHHDPRRVDAQCGRPTVHEATGDPAEVHTGRQQSADRTARHGGFP